MSVLMKSVKWSNLTNEVISEGWINEKYDVNSFLKNNIKNLQRNMNNS